MKKTLILALAVAITTFGCAEEEVAPLVEKAITSEVTTTEQTAEVTAVDEMTIANDSAEKMDQVAADEVTIEAVMADTTAAIEDETATAVVAIDEVATDAKAATEDALKTVEDSAKNAIETVTIK